MFRKTYTLWDADVTEQVQTYVDFPDLGAYVEAVLFVGTTELPGAPTDDDFTLYFSVHEDVIPDIYDEAIIDYQITTHYGGKTRLELPRLIAERYKFQISTDAVGRFHVAAKLATVQA